MLVNVSIDGSLRENVRAQLWVRVARVLQRYAYPPDNQVRATQVVLDRAEAPSIGWAAAT